MTEIDWVPTLTILFAGGSAIAAAAAIFFPWRTHKSQQFLEQAILTLSRAYEALSCNGQEIQPPKSNRLNWLTSARHIEQYRRLKQLIVCKEHKLVCEDQEEYWRHRFYECLKTPTPLSPSYYRDEPKPNGQLGIEPTSAIIIHDFANWPDGKQDPIDLADVDSILKRNQVLKGNIGLRGYLESFPRYKDRI
ncbi:hypothetical protein [Modicisalibacter radicis]|uniref:hypothetical protein n=1 Tax=Halomonas sp. EAR18 TaxID=2518972 RepID=UPI00109CD381|nr:hypothetical protein [Halomonas sp. EAR18]